MSSDFTTRENTVPGSKSPWRTFAVLATIQFLMVVDTTIVYVALPSISRELNFTSTDLGWVMDAYMLGLGGFLLVGGRLADIVGRRRLLTLGVAAFGISAVACAFATGPWALIAGRAAQGISAAMVTPSAMALISDIFDEGPDRYKAYGIFGGIGGVAGATGGILGGLLTPIAWQAIFWVNVPIVLWAILRGVKTLPNVRHPAHSSADIPGAILVAGAGCALLLALIHGGSLRDVDTITTVALAVGILCAIGFIARQRTAADPLVPRSLYAHQNVVVGNAVNAAVGFLMFGSFYVITTFLQEGRGFGVTIAAFFMLPVSLLLFGGSQLGIQILEKLGPPRVLFLGLLTQAVALGTLYLVLPERSTNIVYYLVPACIWGLGLGMSIVAAFVSCTAGLAGPVQGVASGLVNASLQMGGALGVVVMGVLATRQSTAEADVRGYAIGFAAGALIALIAAAISLIVKMPASPGDAHDAPAVHAGADR